MSDLISRQAAIDELRKCRFVVDAIEKIRGLPTAQPEKVCIANITLSEEQLREAVEKAKNKVVHVLPSAQPEQRWIPCSERLPEEDFWSGRGRQFSEHVLVTIVNRGNDDERFTDIAQTVDGIWQLSHDVDGDCSLPNWCEVIAWMPLPEPYKGEET